MHLESRMGLIEQGMHVMRKETPKGETYNPYGGAARMVEVRALAEHGTLGRISKGEMRKGEVCLDGRFVYRETQAFESMSYQNGGMRRI